MKAKNLFPVLVGVMAFSLMACGKKDSRVGGGAKDRKAVSAEERVEHEEDRGAPPARTGGDLPGGVEEGPERIGPGGGASGPRKNPTVTNDTAPPRKGGDLPAAREEADKSARLAAERRPAPAPRVEEGRGHGNLPARERPPRTETRNQAQPWYPPNVEGSPAESWLFHNIDPVMKSIERAGPAPRASQKRLLLTLALGYFDGFQTNPLSYDMVNYGQNAPVDPFLRAAAHEVLTRPCRGLLQVCGFEMIKINQVEAIYRKNGLGGAIQDVRLLSAAVTEQHKFNTGSRSAEQKIRSERAEALFLNSLKDSDLVVYVGHSRNGGGPDFSVPRLKGSRVNYPYYEANRPGLKKLVAALKSGGRRARGLAILSCDSTKFFRGAIQQAAPGLTTMTIAGQVYSEDLVAEGLVTMDFFLRQGTLQGLRAH